MCHQTQTNINTFEARRAVLEIVREYPETQQLGAHECRRRLLRCRDCGQLYFYEFLEWIDWENGNDPQYRTYIPVKDAMAADALNGLDAMRLTQIRPMLDIAWPSDGPKTVRWLA